MLIGQKGVKYGLTVPKQKPKQAAAPPKKKSVFGEEESDDDGQANVEQQIARQAARKQTDKKVAELHAAALAEDASIFDYDAHYEDIQAARVEPKRQEKVARQSKYIASLLEKAEERKQEQSILYERQLAKERAAEDHLFGDKERFVTAAYRKKLAEDQKWLEQEKKRKEAEERNAVEKKGHMGDFYRNLFRSNVAFGAKPGEKSKQQEEPEQAQQAEPSEADAAMEAEMAAAAAAARQEIAGPAATEQGRPGSQVGPAGWEAARAAHESRAAAAAGPSATAEAAAAAAADGRERAGSAPRQDIAAGASGAAAVPGAAGDQVMAKGPRPGGSRAEAQPAGPMEGGAAGAGGDPDQQQGAAAAEAGQRRNREDAVAAARERYLARKRKAGQE